MSESLKKNMLYAFGSQCMQMLQSILVSLVLPKLLGVEQFGFWQLFIFYSQYGGFLHLGLIDGIYLNNGGKRYADLNFSSLAGQLKLLVIWQLLLLIPFIILGLYSEDSNRIFVIIASAIYIFISNIYTYFSYILQSINHIKAFSWGRIINILFFSFSLIVLIVFKSEVFIPYVIVYIIGQIFSSLYYIINLKELAYCFLLPIKRSYFYDVLNNLKVGIFLLVSNLTGMLIVGVGRLGVDMNWGIEMFSKVSFILVFVNFFMMFISQASLVLFPHLRRKEDFRVISVYYRLNKVLYFLLPLLMMLYVPIVMFIKYWLPDYLDASYYLIYLLPLCYFEIKMQLVHNTIYKVFRLERKLLQCNCIAFMVCVILTLISIYLFHSLNAVVASMSISIALRNYIAVYLIKAEVKESGRQIGTVMMYEMSIIVIFILFNLKANLLLL